MAYLNFSEAGSVGSAIGFRPAQRAGDIADFAALEWTVIALARHDRPAGLTPPGATAKLIALLFGRTWSRKLASPRLEALRRAAVLLWHDRPLGPDYVEALFAAGFDRRHVDLLRRTIADAAGARG